MSVENEIMQMVLKTDRMETGRFYTATVKPVQKETGGNSLLRASIGERCPRR